MFPDLEIVLESLYFTASGSHGFYSGEWIPPNLTSLTNFWVIKFVGVRIVSIINIACKIFHAFRVGLE